MTSLINRIQRNEITDADRAKALEATNKFLIKIDISSVDRLRRKFDLPPEALGYVVEVYASMLAGLAPNLNVLPMFSNGPVRRNETVTLKGEISHAPFHADRVFISVAGTMHGAADWIVNDIKVDGKTQFEQAGAIPGDMFACSAIDSFVRFTPGEKQIEMVVTYIGENESGNPFYGSIVGTCDMIERYDDGE